jgi:ADP-ribosylglycohydrolase
VREVRSGKIHPHERDGFSLAGSRIANTPDRLLSLEETVIRSSGNVIDTLSAAGCSSTRLDEFAFAVRNSINLREDSDMPGYVVDVAARTLMNRDSKNA